MLKSLTLDGLIAKGYNHYLAAFDDLLPSLFKAYDDAPDSVKNTLWQHLSKIVKTLE
jgi:acyl-homoserine-lactone acylase